MKDHNFSHKLTQFMAGRGFYIVLALCIAAVGATGYYLLDVVTDPMSSISVDTPESALPEVQQPVAVPEPAPVRPVQKPVEVTLPEETPAEMPQPEPAVPSEAPKPVQTVPTVFTWPVKGEVLRDFSVETLSPDPTMGDWRTHAGVDVAARLGTRVLCMTAGTVTQVWEDERMGACIRVEHGGKLESVYSNLSPQPTVKVGDKVEIGGILGAVGTTAAAESGMEPHLHLEVLRDGQAMDPLELLPAQ